jgi:hypothetical protein
VKPRWLRYAAGILGIVPLPIMVVTFSPDGTTAPLGDEKPVCSTADTADVAFRRLAG